ncbi:hypothetical protein HKX48_006315 [Thoreauomyces humboldtii]|nr:hypothetical protein HKX48_006315 [Thoreauomyces humboldtii]
MIFFSVLLQLWAGVLPVAAVLRWIPVTQVGSPPAKSLDLAGSVSISTSQTLFIGGFNTTLRRYADFTPPDPTQTSAYASTWLVTSTTNSVGVSVWTWSVLNTFGAAAGGVSAAATADGAHVFRWGGVGENPQDPLLSLVHTMTLTNGVWGNWIPMPTTNTPLAVGFAPAVIYNNMFITVGGQANNTSMYNTINAMSISTGVWSILPQPGAVLPAIWGHVVHLFYDFPLRRAVVPLGSALPAVTSDVLLIFSGMLCPQDSWSIGPTCYVAEPGFAYDLVNQIIYVLDTKGTVPPIRAHATSQISVQNGRSVISLTGGGYTDSTYVYWFWSDTWFYDLTDLIWKQAVIVNDPSVPNRYNAISAGSGISVGYGSTFPECAYSDGWTLTSIGGDATNSILQAPATLVVNGGTAVYILTVRDINGLELDYGGDIVSGFLADQLGRTVLGEVTDYANGTYAIGFKITTAGSYSLAINYNGVRVPTSSSTATVSPGPADPTTSIVQLGGNHTWVGYDVSIAVQVRDAFGNALQKSDALAAATAVVSDDGTLARRAIVTASKTYENGNVIFSFLPSDTGTYSVAVSLNGALIGNALPLSVVYPVSLPSKLRRNSSGTIILLLTACISFSIAVPSIAVLWHTRHVFASTHELALQLSLFPGIIFACGYALSVVLPASKLNCTAQPWMAALALGAPAGTLLAQGWSLRQQWEICTRKLGNVDVPFARLAKFQLRCLGPIVVLLIVWTGLRTISTVSMPLARTSCNLDTNAASYPISLLLLTGLGLIYLLSATFAWSGNHIGRSLPKRHQAQKFLVKEKKERNQSSEAYRIVGLSFVHLIISVAVFGVTLTPTPRNPLSLDYETRAVLSAELCLVIGLLTQAVLTFPSALQGARYLRWIKVSTVANDDGSTATTAGKSDICTAFWGHAEDPVAGKHLLELAAEIELMRHCQSNSPGVWKPAKIVTYIAQKLGALPGNRQSTFNEVMDRGRQHFVVLTPKDQASVPMMLNAVSFPRLVYLRTRSVSSPSEQESTYQAPESQRPVLTFSLLTGETVRLRFTQLGEAARWLSVAESIAIASATEGEKSGGQATTHPAATTAGARASIGGPGHAILRSPEAQAEDSLP